MNDEEHYHCVGVCLPDPDSGRCMGCDRPLIEMHAVSDEASSPEHIQASESPFDSANK